MLASPEECVGAMGLLFRNLMTLEVFPWEETSVTILLNLDKVYLRYSTLWQSLPSTWNKANDSEFSRALLELIQYSRLQGLLSEALQAMSREVDRLPLSSLSGIQEDLIACLPIIQHIWDTNQEVSMRRSAVACLNAVRKVLGDSEFFHSLPDLSSSQRRLLDAYYVTFV